MNTGRLGGLADGVFSIVMTLLVFEMTIPFIENQAALSSVEVAEELLNQVLALGPNIISYILSFIILGVYWVGHHTQFQYIKRADANLLWLNIIFLMSISLIPFTAGFLSRFSDQQLPVAIYCANLIAAAVTHMALWEYATVRRRGLIDDDTTPEFIRLGRTLSIIPIGFYIVAILLSFVSPQLSVPLITVVPVLYVSGWIYRVVGSTDLTIH